MGPHGVSSSRRPTPALAPAPALAARPDKHALYELCAQAPDHVAALLRAIHADSPTTLAEDFCGTAAVSAAWCRVGGRAFAADIHPTLVKRAGRQRGVTARRADVTKVPPRHPPADVIFVGNFSIGEIHDRPSLIAYLRSCCRRLTPRGTFVCDLYGGTSAMTPSMTHRTLRAPDGSRVRYTWEQRSADPLTSLVENAMHFEVRSGRRVRRIANAFTYHWRLWSIPELRDAMTEAGFRSVDIYPPKPDAMDDSGAFYVSSVEDSSELGDDWVAFIAARKA